MAEKMQMEAREHYRRDKVAAQDFVIEQCEEKIQELKDNLQHLQEESIQKDERIRFLEEQLARAHIETAICLGF